MPNTFAADTVYLATAEDMAAPERITDPAHELADLLREYGPEGLVVGAWLWDGSLEELTQETAFCGKDEIAKYYVTTYTSPRTGFEIKIGWDT